MRKIIPSIILLLLSALVNPSLAQWYSDTIKFEQPSADIKIDTSPGTLWQIGVPQKTFFNAAHSATKAIVTDTVNHYPINSSSSFTLVIRNQYTQTCLSCMEFWQKYDMDTLKDIGIIEASYDGGNSWLALQDTSNFSPMYSTLYWYMDYHETSGLYKQHPKLITGRSDGWIQSEFCWQWYYPVKTDTIIPMPDSLLVRFTFNSDSIPESRDGWMIDDFIVLASVPNNCTSIEEFTPDLKISISPDPFIDRAILRSDTYLKNAAIRIFSYTGQLLKQYDDINGSEFTISRNGLSAGIYILKLNGPGIPETNARFVIIDN